MNAILGNATYVGTELLESLPEFRTTSPSTCSFSWLSDVAVACQRCRASDPGSLPGLASGGDKYSLLMHCIKIKSPVKFLLNEQYVFVGGNISFFVCYHVVPKRHSQLDYELNGL